MSDSVQVDARPPWKSKKWTAFVLLMAATLAVAFAGPLEVAIEFGRAIGWAAPGLILGQSWVDARLK